MSTQVIVLKRVRRRFFSIPRGIPGLMRALWVARPGQRPQQRRVPARLDDLDEVIAGFATAVPQLVFDSKDQHRCVGCNLCVQICPSRCLRMENTGTEESPCVTRFELARSSCISCGACRDTCPEAAIEMVSGARVSKCADVGTRSMIDLLMARD